jgi:hypothetical protein
VVMCIRISCGHMTDGHQAHHDVSSTEKTLLEQTPPLNQLRMRESRSAHVLDCSCVVSRQLSKLGKLSLACMHG